jgi:hypothetical protein
MCETCCTLGANEKFIRNIDLETQREEATWEIQT